LFIYVYSKREQKSYLQLSNLQCCHFDIVILRVAITSNVKNVRLQRRHMPTSDIHTVCCLLWHKDDKECRLTKTGALLSESFMLLFGIMLHIILLNKLKGKQKLK